MTLLKALFVIISAICCFNNAYASTEDPIGTSSSIFHPGFHTLQICVDGNEYAPAVIELNSNDRVLISFDEIADDRRYMRYTLIHCDAQWRPSNLVDSEYIDGFNQGDVDDYEYSQLTSTRYVHYSIALPNDQIKFTISGNYLLQVYDEESTELLLQARFSVSENSMKVNADVSSRTDIDYNNRHQQLSISVNSEKVNIHDIYNDLTVIIQQNRRHDNQRVIKHPLRVTGKVAYYEHQQPLIFKAGNEYRRMEIVSTSYPGMGVDEIYYHAPFYHMKLATDQTRYADNYSYDQTQCGQYTIREYNSEQSHIEADYIIVHFALEMPKLINSTVYLEGEFTQRQFSKETIMAYNPTTGAYEKDILLKQGAYNYQYLVMPTNSTTGSASVVEGDFYQTVNEYLIMVYHRPPGSRYDHLVGMSTIFSGR